MGTYYMVVDEGGKNALDVGKFYALWWVAAGKTGRSTDLRNEGHPVTVETITEAAKGWFLPDHWKYAGTDLAELAEPQDVRFSAKLAALVAGWQAEVAQGRPLRIFEEGFGPCGSDMEPKEDWGALWTLYVHPVTRDARPPFRLWSGQERPITP